MFCTGGNKWFVINGNLGNVYSCHIRFYKNEKQFKLSEDIKLREDECKETKCDNKCDYCHIIKSNKRDEIKSQNQVHILFYTNDMCMNECEYCNIPSKKSNNLDINDMSIFYKNLLKIYPNYNYSILFCGGEPTFHPYIEKCILYTHEILGERLNYVELYSNGILNHKIEKILKSCKKKQLDKIIFRISAHPTGKMFNLYNWTKTILLIKKYNAKLSVKIVNHECNKMFIPIIKNITEKLNIEFQTVQDNHMYFPRYNMISNILCDKKNILKENFFINL